MLCAARIYRTIFAASLITSIYFNYVETIEPLLTGSLVAAAVAGGGTAYFYGLVDSVKCQFYECCSDKYIVNNITGLRRFLNQRVYGQHLVIDATIKSIAGHIKGPSKKALVLSFHGWTGGGKNYVSNIIAQHLYAKGSQSKFVHHFIAGEHFPHLDEASTDSYKANLRSWVRGNVSACSRSLFIFDEADKMPLGVLDVLKPYLDYHEHVDHVDYRDAIFIFLSNTGGRDIARQSLKHYRSGQQREALTVFNLQEQLQAAALNEDDSGGLWHSTLIQHHLVDLFLPFLPLERCHVERCVRDVIRSRSLPADHSTLPGDHSTLPGDHGTLPGDHSTLVARVLDEVQWYPQETPIYSISGCKRLPQIVNNILPNTWPDDDDGDL